MALVTDEEIIAFRDRLIAAREAVSNDWDYNRYHDDFSEGEEQAFERQIEQYGRAIAALNALLHN